MKKAKQRPGRAKATQEKPSRGSTAATRGIDVPTLLRKLEHGRKDEIDALRSIISSVDRNLTEQVKWNAPSFCYQGNDRITFRLQPAD